MTNNPRGDVAAIAAMNIVDRLIDKLIKKDVLTDADFGVLLRDTVAQVHQSQNPRALEIEAWIRELYGAKMQ